MAKAMSFFGLAAGLLLALGFAADMFLGIPFGGANTTMDIGFAVSGLILAYMSWDALRSTG